MNSEVRLAHEIARQFANEPREQAVETVVGPCLGVQAGEDVGHITLFWAPTMISTRVTEADRAADLDPVVAEAVDRLR